MKKNYFFALFASLMLFMAMPATAQMTSIADVYGKWKFTADLQVVNAEHADLFLNECEVVIAKGENGYPAKISGFGGADQVMSINSFDLTAGTICNLNPNTPPLWTGFFMANADGGYPYGDETRYTTINLTYDAATETLTYPDFTVVTCDHSAQSATVVAKYTNVKLTLVEREVIIIPEIAGEWAYTPYYANNDSTFVKEFKMTLTAKDDTNTAWSAEFDFEGFDKFTLDATFDGISLKIPFDSLYLDKEKGIRFGIGATSSAPEKVFVKKGVIDFTYDKPTKMTQGEYIYIRQEGVELDSLGNEVAVAPIVQRLRGGTIVRKDPNAYDWSGTYTLNVDEDGYLPYAEIGDFADEFGTKVVIEEYQGGFAITELLGYKIESEYNYITLEDGDTEGSLKINVAVTGWGPSVYLNTVNPETYTYRVITGFAGAETLDVVLEEDGTISISDFLVQEWTYGKAEMEKIALISGASMNKEVFDWAGTYVLTATVATEEGVDAAAFPAEFEVEVKLHDDGEYRIAKFLETDVYTFNQGCTVVKVAENGNSATLSLSQSYGMLMLGGAYPDYLTMNDKDGNATSLNIALGAGDVLTMDDFTVNAFNYNTYASSKLATYSNVTLTKKAVDTAIEGVAVENNAVKGIFDMQGRKIEAITAPGLYIINGAKVLVK